MSHEPSTYPPSQTALLLLDYQNLIVHGRVTDDSARAKVIHAASTLLAAARKNKAPIAHCLIGMKEDPRETSKFFPMWESNFKPLRDNDPSKIAEIEELAIKEETELEINSEKLLGVISAMKTEKLLKFLEKRGVKSLVIAGLVTSGATLSTAREAADLGFVTTVVEDGCWDSKGEVHKAVMEGVLPMTGYVVGLEEGVKLLGGQ